MDGRIYVFDGCKRKGTDCSILWSSIFKQDSFFLRCRLWRKANVEWRKRYKYTRKQKYRVEAMLVLVLLHCPGAALATLWPSLEIVQREGERKRGKKIE